MHFNHQDNFYSDNEGCAQRLIEFTNEVQIEDEFIYIMTLSYFGIQFTDKYIRVLYDLNFVINGKAIFTQGN